MDKKRNYYVDWWKIKKSSVISVIVVFLFLGLLVGGTWWAMKNNWFFAGQENANAPKDAARLISFEGDVRITRAATRETEKVSKDTFLLAGDTIQTQADGKAQIRMIDGSVLTVRPNSTVVIRDSASIFGGTNVKVELGDGQINVKTQDQNEASNNIVEVKQVENKLQSQTDASFNSSSNGGEIRISRGGVESNVGGEKTVIKDGEFASINQNGRLSPKERLYEPPKLIAPPTLEQVLTTSNGTADLTFRWQKSDGTTNFSFSLEVASSPFFVKDGMVIQRDSLTAPNFTMGNIAPGVYYWRVRGTASSGQTTEWSEPFRFTIVKREGNETLTASDWQSENIGGKVYIISGKTISGATVRILGRETFAGADGSFRIQVSVPGPEATVEISDEHGNRNRYVLSVESGKVVKQF
ncbi:MAG: FecR domain-containing protein [Pyrinomonadaceae bacterium]|nr:FecR domain-containing protein [Pyrinomonadaceae bacterium]